MVSPNGPYNPEQKKLTMGPLPLNIPSSWLSPSASLHIISFYWNAIHSKHYIPDQVHGGGTIHFLSHFFIVIKYTKQNLQAQLFFFYIIKNIFFSYF